VNKNQLIDALSSRFGGNKRAARHALESVLDTITREVAKGEKVAITGFGSFEKRVRSARMVRNPRTGERIKAKATQVPKFTAGQDLKNIVSGAKKLPKLIEETAAPTVLRVAAAASPTKKTTTKKTTAKKSAAKKASTAKKAVKKAVKKATGKTAAAKKSTAGKAPAKTAAKKAPAKKSAAKKAPAKKSAAKKAPAKKSAAKKAPAKKSAAKKAPARKAAKKR
jgi:DNA-binding protein HU-beta